MGGEGIDAENVWVVFALPEKRLTRDIVGCIMYTCQTYHKSNLHDLKNCIVTKKGLPDYATE